MTIQFSSYFLDVFTKWITKKGKPIEYVLDNIDSDITYCKVELDKKAFDYLKEYCPFLFINNILPNEFTK